MSNLGNKETMAKNLKFYLDRSGKTQKDLAEVIGVSTATLSDWMRAKKYPRIDKIEMLANFFGILKSDLIEEKTKEQKEMQKKNDILSDIILKLNADSELLAMVYKITKLGVDQIEAVKSVLNAFPTVEK